MKCVKSSLTFEKQTDLIQPFEGSIKMLDFSRQMYHMKTNNTSHAFRKICAPWGVTFFWRLYHAV